MITLSLSIIFCYLLYVFRRKTLTPVIIFSHLSLLSMLVFNAHSECILFYELDHMYTAESYHSERLEVNVVLAGIVLFGYILSKFSLRCFESNGLSMEWIPSKIFSFCCGLLLILIGSLLLIHFFDINYAKLIEYNTYLAIRDATFVGLDLQISRFIHTNLINLLLVLSLIFSIFLYSKRLMLSLLCLPSLLYILLYSLAQHSRAAALSILIISGSFAIRGRRLIIFYLLVLVSVAIYCHSINIRDQGRIAHREFGLSQYFSDDGLGLFLSNNSLESIQRAIFNVSGVGFNLGFYFKQDQPSQGNSYYKIKSFSPFPSTIDGFSSMRDSSQLRFSYFCPYSTYSELLSFGSIYLLFYFFVLGVAFLLNGRVFTENRITGLLCGGPLLYAILLQGAYPVRHTFRLVLLSVILCSLALFVFKRKYAPVNLEGN